MPTDELFARALIERTAKSEVRLGTLETVQIMHHQAIEKLEDSLGGIKGEMKGLKHALYAIAFATLSTEAPTVLKVVLDLLGAK